MLASSLNDQYTSLVWSTWYNGLEVPSRFGLTHEVLGGSIVMNAGEVPDRARMNLQVGWIELVQLLAGRFDKTAYERRCPKANLDLFTYEMAYGPRIVSYDDNWVYYRDSDMAAPAIPPFSGEKTEYRNRIRRVLVALEHDPLSRQAILYIGRPNETGTSRHSCTTCIQFLIRREAVHAIVTMRSWDLLKGLPYDLMMFGGLTEAVARHFGLQAASVRVVAGSAHVYEEDVKRGMLPVGLKYGPDGLIEDRFYSPTYRKFLFQDESVVTPSGPEYTKEPFGKIQEFFQGQVGAHWNTMPAGLIMATLEAGAEAPSITCEVPA